MLLPAVTPSAPHAPHGALWVAQARAAAAPEAKRAAAKKRSIIDFMRARLAQSREERFASEEEQKLFAAGERIFRYDSVNEHLVMLSLSRALKRREWRRAGRLALGWLANYFIFTALLLVFVVYGCVFDETSTLDEGESDALLLYSWAWSILQRFVVNEPAIILVGVMVPLLFATECCANLCTESTNNVLGVCIAMLITFFKRMRRA